MPMSNRNTQLTAQVAVKEMVEESAQEVVVTNSARQ